MKYNVSFIHKNGKPECTTTLIFGETDAVGAARYCFEYGKSGRYKEMVITRTRTEKDRTYNVERVKKRMIKLFKKYFGDNWNKAPYLVEAIELLENGSDERKRQQY